MGQREETSGQTGERPRRPTDVPGRPSQRQEEQGQLDEREGGDPDPLASSEEPGEAPHLRPDARWHERRQIARLERTGEVSKTLMLVSPVNGIVLDKDVLEGQRIMPGQRLYRIADLSQVWVEGEVFEQDLHLIREGARAHIEVAAYPGEHVMGRVSFVYPTVNVQSRTNRVRVTVPNRDLRLKPGMFATIYFDAWIGSER